MIEIRQNSLSIIIWVALGISVTTAICLVNKVSLVPILQGWGLLSDPTFFVRRAVELSSALTILAASWIIGRFGQDDDFLPYTGQQSSIIVRIVMVGVLVRLMLAFQPGANFDIQSYEIVADIVLRGGNVYAETTRYNYSPVWSLILALCTKLQLALGGVEFKFVVRSFLCLVDLLTLLVLLGIAKKESQPLIRVALFFFLNPVSFLITGYHGQFENLAILSILFGIWVYLRLLSTRTIIAKTGLWAFATLGTIVKHIVWPLMLVGIIHAVHGRRAKLMLLFLSSMVFLATFTPYWNGGTWGIIKNVFGYASKPGDYGITSILFGTQLHHELAIVLGLGLFIFPFLLKGDDIVQHCLMSMLFFLVFTIGFADQYLVLPIAFAALRPSLGARLYCLIAGIYLAGSGYNLGLWGFSLVKVNVVWFAAIYWFMTEFYDVSICLRRRSNI